MSEENTKPPINRHITRRDFLDGVAVAVGALGLEGAAHAETHFQQDSPGYYPPALTGMRGSHDGSYDVAHALRDANFWNKAVAPTSTGETFDLIVVGGGISGLSPPISTAPGTRVREF